jgi:hypothetical protein
MYENVSDNAGGIANDATPSGTAEIINNIFLKNDDVAIEALDDPISILNNDFYQNFGGIYRDPVTTFTDVALLNSAKPFCTDNIACDPGIEIASDYRLESGSCCIDAGTSHSAPSDDFDGDSRPHGAGYDIGADEFTTGSTVPITKVPVIVLLLAGVGIICVLETAGIRERF